MVDVLKRDEQKQLELPEPPKVAQVSIEPAGFHVHHSVIGAAIIAGGILAGVVAPAIRSETRGVIVVASVALGAALIWDDVQAHLAGGCSMDTIWQFLPCPEREARVTVVRKVEP